jgi:hypothetical protein
MISRKITSFNHVPQQHRNAHSEDENDKDEDHYGYESPLDIILYVRIIPWSRSLRRLVGQAFRPGQAPPAMPKAPQVRRSHQARAQVMVLMVLVAVAVAVAVAVEMVF